ncbi:MAG: hypothetical protein WAV98_00810 [Minisyncoccia bacterium]
MAKNAKVVTPRVVNVELPHGFKAIPTVAMELDVLMLKKAITPRMDSLRKAIGTSKAEKLSGFCAECLQFGKTVYVTVVAKTIAQNGNGQSYLCLCPCGDDSEMFTISSSFLRAVDIDKNHEIKRVQATQPQQQKVAYAT